MNNLYRVVWESVTGTTGHGEPLLKEVAEEWVDKGNREYPEIRHRAVTESEFEEWRQRNGKQASLEPAEERT